MHSADTRPAAGQTVLFLPSSPLHILWCLGLAAGPFREARCVLAKVNARNDKRDFVFEALQSAPRELFAEIHSFPRLTIRHSHGAGGGRRVMASITHLSRALQPEYIITGNDVRPEFYGALQGAPGAIGACVDDGWGCYRRDLPPRGLHGVWQQLERSIDNAVRRLTLGVRTERPFLLGASSVLKETWLMVPEFASAALAGKVLHALDPAWFRDAHVAQICSSAIRQSGLDPDRLESVGLLLIMPHRTFALRHPEFQSRLEDLVREHRARGLTIAYKHHPSRPMEGLQLPGTGCIEIPRRLPVEILAPYLGDTLAVGSMTSALLFLPRLAPGIRAQALVPLAGDDPVTHIYRSMGIGTIDAPRREAA